MELVFWNIYKHCFAVINMNINLEFILNPDGSINVFRAETGLFKFNHYGDVFICVLDPAHDRVDT